VHAGKLGQVTNFTIVGGTAKHGLDQYVVLFRYVIMRKCLVLTCFCFSCAVTTLRWNIIVFSNERAIYHCKML